MNETVEKNMLIKKPKGVATIQIFDEGGSLIEEKKQENYVHPRMLEAIMTAHNYVPFVKDPLSYSSLVYSQNLVSGICLTDYDAEPDPDKEYYIRGNVVGFGSKGVSGGKEKRGAYNPIESVHTNSYNKWVFDFATSEGNGTFNSIYTGPFNARADKISLDQPVLGEFALDDAERVGFFHKDRAFFYSNSYGISQFTVYDTSELPSFMSTGTLLPRLDTVKKSEIPAIKDSSIMAVIGVGEKLYYFTYAGPYRSYYMEVHSADMYEPRNATLVKSLTATETGTIFGGATSIYVGGGSYEAETNSFYLFDRTKMYILDGTTFQLKEAFTYPVNTDRNLNGEGSYNSISRLERGAMLTGTAFWDRDTGKITAGLEGAHSYTATYSGMWHVSLSEVNKLFSLLNHDNTNNGSKGRKRIVPAVTFFSRAKLDAPVTKTSQNTMKITYEFFHEPVSFVAEAGY